MARLYCAQRIRADSVRRIELGGATCANAPAQGARTPVCPCGDDVTGNGCDPCTADDCLTTRSYCDVRLGRCGESARSETKCRNKYHHCENEMYVSKDELCHRDGVRDSDLCKYFAYG